MTLCKHCKALPLDPDQPETGLCPECLDLAVWGGECPFCNEVPTKRLCNDLR